MANAGEKENQANTNASQTIKDTSAIIDGRSYPVATKVTAYYHRALAYEQENQFGKAIEDCKAALKVDDQVWYMNHDDIRAIRLIKDKARKKLEELESKTRT